jgi:hypothetical protein
MSVAARITNPVAQPVQAAPAPILYRFSVEQYDRMAELGIFGGDDRAELIEGLIVRKMTQNPPHPRAVTRLMKQLIPLLPKDWDLRVQGPIALARSRPEPDFAVVRGPDKRYADRHPRPAEIGLLIEVGDSSFLSDRRSKIPLYAAARIVEVWLVNLVEGQVEVYAHPRGGKSPAYREQRDYRAGEEVPLVIGGKELARLAVSDLCLLTP